MNRRVSIRFLNLVAICAALFLGLSEAATATPTSIPSPKNFPAQDTFSIQGGRWVTNYSADSVLQAHALVYLNRF